MTRALIKRFEEVAACIAKLNLCMHAYAAGAARSKFIDQDVCVIEIFNLAQPLQLNLLRLYEDSILNLDGDF
jgi:hypothetical protein